MQWVHGENNELHMKMLDVHTKKRAGDTPLTQVIYLPYEIFVLIYKRILQWFQWTMWTMKIFNYSFISCSVLKSLPSRIKSVARVTAFGTVRLSAVKLGHPDPCEATRQAHLEINLYAVGKRGTQFLPTLTKDVLWRAVPPDAITLMCVETENGQM